MAPEVLLNENYNDSVDTYSFGLVLWYMCTGAKPLESSMRAVSSARYVSIYFYMNMLFRQPVSFYIFIYEYRYSAKPLGNCMRAVSSALYVSIYFYVNMGIVPSRSEAVCALFH